MKQLKSIGNVVLSVASLIAAIGCFLSYLQGDTLNALFMLVLSIALSKKAENPVLHITVSAEGCSADKKGD